MKVKDLKKLLENEDDNAIVIIQKDSEGNGYSPLYSTYTGYYEAENNWSGEISLEKDSNGIPALVLQPRN